MKQHALDELTAIADDILREPKTTQARSNMHKYMPPDIPPLLGSWRPQKENHATLVAVNRAYSTASSPAARPPLLNITPSLWGAVSEYPMAPSPCAQTIYQATGFTPILVTSLCPMEAPRAFAPSNQHAWAEPLRQNQPSPPLPHIMPPLPPGLPPPSVTQRPQPQQPCPPPPPAQEKPPPPPPARKAPSPTKEKTPPPLCPARRKTPSPPALPAQTPAQPNPPPAQGTPPAATPLKKTSRAPRKTVAPTESDRAKAEKIVRDAATYKTTPCNKKSPCPFGSKCRFLHEGELSRVRPSEATICRRIDEMTQLLANQRA